MKIKLLPLLFMCFMLIQSCVRPYDPDCPKFSTKYTTLTPEAIKQTPYFTNPDFDTISYASDKGDTVTFVKTKTDTSWYCENEYPSGPDCGPQTKCYQILHSTYATIKGSGSFDVKHVLRTNNLVTNEVQITFNELIFKPTDYRIGTSNGSTLGVTFFENINLNNNTYKKVNKYYHELNQSDMGICFINVNYGLIRLIDIENNLTFDLLIK
jgi:hypothetical protein